MVYPLEKNKQIYLDGASTTPIRSEVLKRILQIEANCWGNPSSIHYEGIKASESLERSRKSICNILGSNISDIIFTSGSTESNHLGIIGPLKNLPPSRIVISSVEHPSVISAANILKDYGWDIAYWPVNNYGEILFDRADEFLSPPTKFVSIAWAQGEIGTIQPIAKIGKLCNERDILFHTDATQIICHKKINWNEIPVDLLSGSSHKFQGPKGIGFLLCKRDKIKLAPLITGGGQENGYRSGTQPVSLIGGMALALELGYSHLDNNSKYLFEHTRVLRYTKDLYEQLKNIDNLRFTGHPSNRLFNHISMLVGNITSNRPLNGSRVVMELSKYGVSASSGTACNSGKLLDSEVLKSIGLEKEWRQSGLRFTLGPWLDEHAIYQIPAILIKCIDKVSSDNQN